MTIQTLSNVTLETIENYRHAAALAVGAYRAGSHRLIDAVNGGLEKNVYVRTVKVAPKLTSTLKQVRGGLSDIIVKGVDQFSMRTGKAIEVSSTTAAAQVSKVADFAAGIDNRAVVNGIDIAVRLSMPGAQAALAVSAKVAEGADKLSRAVGVKKAKVVRAAKAAPKKLVRAKRAIVRKAATTKATVTRKATAVQRKAVATTKATVTRAKRKTAKVAEAVAA
jgi:hypothetical protein